MKHRTDTAHLDNQIQSPEDDSRACRQRATVALAEARHANRFRTRTLRIDNHTSILVAPENCNSSYAEAWREKRKTIAH